MTILVLGLKAPLTTWCSGVVGSLLARSSGCAGEFDAGSAAELIHHMLSQKGPFVATVSRPGRIIRDAISSSKARFVVSTASPAESVAYIAAETGTSHIDALRQVLDLAAALAAVPLTEFGLRVGEDALTRHGPAWVSRIAAHLELHCSDGEAEEIHGEVAARMTAPPVRSEGDRTAATAESAREDAVAVQAAVGGLSDLLKDGTCDRIVATRRLFTVADTGQPPLGPIDATGRNRLLVYGPFIALPPGDWTARCVYGFSAGMVGTQLTAEVRGAGGGQEFARTTFNVASPGRFDVNIRFTHTDPATHLEVKLFCDRAIFDGQVSVGFVEFKRHTVEPVLGDDLQEMISGSL